MTFLPHHRLANWLTGLVVAIWPVATAHACCCPSGGSETNECGTGCCAAADENGPCCSGGAEEFGVCCVTSAERNACGCDVQCGQAGPDGKAAGTIVKSNAAPPETLAGGWNAAWPAIGDDVADRDADAIPQRPKRILYSVWRN